MEHARFYAAAKHRGQTASDKLRWNGERRTFKPFKNDVEGTLIRLGMGHLFNSWVVAQYQDTSNYEFAKSDEFWEKFHVSYNQFVEDSRYLYGILRSATKDRVDPIVNSYVDTQNGLAAWTFMVEKHSCGGEDEELLSKLERQIMTPYDPVKHKDPLSFSDRFYSWVTELQSIKLSPYTDNDYKRYLLRSLENQTQMAHLLEQCRNETHWSFA